jgi:ribonuclease R
MIEGIFSANERGFGFVAPDGGTGDLFIPPDQIGNAWHGDRVLVLPADDPDGRGPAGRIVKVLSRGTKEITGRLNRSGKKGWVTPDDRRFPERIGISKHSHKFQDGDKVGFKVTSYGDKQPAAGEVTAVLGRDGTFAAAVEAILFTQGVRREFSKAAVASARNMPQAVPEDAVKGRADLREMLIFTIDGEHAKDLDDAISLTYDEQSRPVLGVHIADVSHYVQTDSPLDKSAFQRGTSVYFADQVVPMLPKDLSNGICSLHGGVDRLCLSVFMTLDENCQTTDMELTESVIHSKYRMTYEACNKILDGSLDHPLADTLNKMNSIAKKMSFIRTSKGSLDIETIESEVVCDDSGVPVDIVPRERGDSERLIEAFMLAANEAVANYLFWPEAPCVYRVHEAPNPEKLEILYALALAKGLKVKKSKIVSGAFLQAILDSARGLPFSRVLNTAMLRGMMKAKYSSDNLGHFGLASACYCHFTSPIRRYPDLMVHRAVKSLLGVSAQDETFRLRCSEAASQSTARELIADSTERLVEKLYKALYMKQFVGEELDGVISGVQSYGMFIELPNTVEGLVPVHTMHDDMYDIDELGLYLMGVNTKKKYEIGDAVRVTCVAANELTGRVDFELV